MATLVQGLRDDQLAKGASISAATNYVVSNFQPDSNCEIILRPTSITTSLVIAVAVSLDGVNWMTVYTSVTMTAAVFRRIIFSEAGAASDTDSATVGATINKAQIFEPFIQVTLTPVGAAVVNLDVLFT